MDLIVQKFGGSSVANTEKLLNAARIVSNTYRQGKNVVVVVSAQGDTTDELIEKAQQVNPKPSRREMDMLLSTGEQISASLLAMVLEGQGLPVISLTGWQAGFLTDSTHGSARIRKIDTERVENELAKRNIVIVTGFQGVNRYDDITTLGRGGSDTSAVALAAALKAERCQIYTDVDGIYTADPRVVAHPVKLDFITYDEMLELASLGAQILHNRSVEMAKKYRVKLEVLSSLGGKPGTEVREVVRMEKMLVKGVACDKNVARIALISVPDKPGVAYQVFSILSAKKVNVDIILQSIGRGGTKDISFTVSKEHKAAAVEALKEELELIGAQGISCDEKIAKVSIVGAGMQSNPGVASTMFEALYTSHINIHMISTSEIKISVLVDVEDAEKAVKAIHEAFHV